MKGQLIAERDAQVADGHFLDVLGQPMVPPDQLKNNGIPAGERPVVRFGNVIAQAFDAEKSGEFQVRKGRIEVRNYLQSLEDVALGWIDKFAHRSLLVRLLVWSFQAYQRGSGLFCAADLTPAAEILRPG
ncbi:hypothetical protein ACLD9I_004016 [Pseudomonas aeruginosa]